MSGNVRSHEDVQGLLGAYALDALDPDEVAVVEEHLETCPRCRAEVADHREVAALLSYAGEPAPAGAWDRLAAALEEPPLASAPPRLGASGPAVAARRERRDRRRDGRLRRLAATAALGSAAAVIAVAGLAGYELRGSGPAQPAAVGPGPNQLARLAAEAALSSGTRTAHLKTADDRSVADVVVQADGTGYLVGKQVGRLPDGRTYQLWAVAKGQKLSVGVLGPNVDVAAFRVDPRAVDALAITDEAAPGVVASANPPVAYGLLGASSGGTATTTP